jgi:hypothetical protein
MVWMGEDRWWLLVLRIDRMLLILRPAHLAYYKSSAEYKLLWLLEIYTQVNLKHHDNTFGLIPPTRTFYLQAPLRRRCKTGSRPFLAISTINSVSTPIPIPQAKGSGSQGPFPPSSSPSAHAASPFIPSDLEDAMPTIHQPTQPTTSSSKQGSLSMAPSKSTAPPNDPTKVILGRFDREFYFGLPVLDAREKILTIMSHD